MQLMLGREAQQGTKAILEPTQLGVGLGPNKRKVRTSKYAQLGLEEVVVLTSRDGDRSVSRTLCVSQKKKKFQGPYETCKVSVVTQAGHVSIKATETRVDF